MQFQKLIIVITFLFVLLPILNNFKLNHIWEKQTIEMFVLVWKHSISKF